MKNILVKASGDVVEKQAFISMIENLSQLVQEKICIICGSGKQINETLVDMGLEVKYCDIIGDRLIETDQEDEIARKVLKETRDKLKRALSHIENIEVKGSWKEEGGDYFHINADDLFREYLPGYTHAFIYTFTGNEDKKRKTFENHSNVEIIGL